jgi:hypothetical protein
LSPCKAATIRNENITVADCQLSDDIEIKGSERLSCIAEVIKIQCIDDAKTNNQFYEVIPANINVLRMEVTSSGSNSVTFTIAWRMSIILSPAINANGNCGIGHWLADTTAITTSRTTQIKT